jgi:hypothetical protein
VREGPSPRFGSSPPPLLGQSGMKKLGVGKDYMAIDFQTILLYDLFRYFLDRFP